MADHPAPRPGATQPVRFALRAAKLRSAVQFDNVDIDVQAETVEQARKLIREFWDRLEGREEPSDHAQSEAVVEGDVDPVTTIDIEKIERRMVELGWNKSELARRAEMGTGHLSAIFLGKVKLTPKVRQKLLSTLGIESRPSPG